ncbi:MAG: hypothetical protein PHI49_06585 [Halothiobacillaceae bacterium]|nr:hypothetical protein [Halothiobacillaceae bacterium]
MKRMNALFLIGMIGFFVAGSQLATHMAEAFWGDRDIWWTHVNMQPTLEQARGEVHVRVNGQPLETALAQGQVRWVASGGETVVLTPQQVTVRLNNWPAQQARQLHMAVYSALLFGFSLACLGIGLWQMWRKRPSQ